MWKVYTKRPHIRDMPAPMRPKASHTELHGVDELFVIIQL